jgi:hypothetical protein
MDVALVAMSSIPKTAKQRIKYEEKWITKKGSEMKIKWE